MPRWFLVILSACSVVASIALVVLASASAEPVGRYQPIRGERVILDTRTGWVCAIDGSRCYESFGPEVPTRGR